MADALRLVAARRHAAESMLSVPDLLQGYLEKGGLQSDLKNVVSAGNRAESLAFGGAKLMGDKPVDNTGLEQFRNLKHSYGSIMAVVHAVRRDLEKAKYSAKLIRSVDALLADKLEVLRPKAKTNGKRSNKPTREAVRVEILKHAEALRGLTAIHAPLAERKVDLQRMDQLRNAALELEGQLEGKASKKKQTKRVMSKPVRMAIKEQMKDWRVCVRLLRLLGTQEERVRWLLKDTQSKKE